MLQINIVKPMRKNPALGTILFTTILPPSQVKDQPGLLESPLVGETLRKTVEGCAEEEGDGNDCSLVRAALQEEWERVKERLR